VAPLLEQEVLPQVQEAPLESLEALLQELEAQVGYHLQEMGLALALAQLEVQVLESGVKQALKRVQAQVRVSQQAQVQVEGQE
jgi:hypothetical protein